MALPRGTTGSLDPTFVPARHGRWVRTTEQSGQYFTVASSPAETRDSQAPAYATQIVPLFMTRVQLRCTGSFRLDAGIRRLHRNHKFAEPFAKTVDLSFHHSCRSELTRQGISLGFSYSVSREAGLYLSRPVFITEAISRISSMHSAFKCFP